jgi:hypothetical protein
MSRRGIILRFDCHIPEWDDTIEFWKMPCPSVFVASKTRASVQNWNLSEASDEELDVLAEKLGDNIEKELDWRKQQDPLTWRKTARRILDEVKKHDIERRSQFSQVSPGVGKRETDIL